MKKTRFTSLRTPSPSVHRSGQYLEQIKAPGHHALRRLPVRMIGRWKCWDGRSRFGEDRAWSHASIPVASAGLTDELFNQDAAVQFYTMLRREYTAAGPAPHGSLAVVVMTHASAGSSNAAILRRKDSTRECTGKDGRSQVIVVQNVSRLGLLQRHRTNLLFP